MNPLKSLAKTLLPQGIRNALKMRFDSQYRERQEWEEDRQIGQRVFGITSGRVVAGPFKGLEYVSTARGSSIGPKLLGTYELELREVVEQIVERGYQTVINIGAGEGYYSVGLAKRLPQAKIVSFDAEPMNQEQIKTLAKLNGVLERIEVKGFCDDASLQKAIDGQSKVLVICDIEGFEVEVLNPQSVPALKNADLLVEMHDIIRPDCSPIIRGRFEATHDIEVIPTRKRTYADFPDGVEMPKSERLTSMEERRGDEPMTFFWMRART